MGYIPFDVCVTDVCVTSGEPCLGNVLFFEGFQVELCELRYTIKPKHNIYVLSENLISPLILVRVVVGLEPVLETLGVFTQTLTLTPRGNF